jgi:hypothetical protein
MDQPKGASLMGSSWGGGVKPSKGGCLMVSMAMVKGFWRMTYLSFLVVQVWTMSSWR